MKHPDTKLATGEQLSPHFKDTEFACTCQGKYCYGLPDEGMDERLIEVIEEIRVRCDAPITINSGYRCPSHNKNCGGVKSSQHLLGTAADTKCPSLSLSDYRKIIKEVIKEYSKKWDIGFGYGKYPTFTHIDTRRNIARW